MTPSGKVHNFKVGNCIATWFDTGAFGPALVFGVVIAAGPKMYRVRWESGYSNRLEQGRTCCWLRTPDDWKEYTPEEIQRIEKSLGGAVITKQG